MIDINDPPTSPGEITCLLMHAEDAGAFGSLAEVAAADMEQLARSHLKRETNCQLDVAELMAETGCA